MRPRYVRVTALLRVRVGLPNAVQGAREGPAQISCACVCVCICVACAADDDNDSKRTCPAVAEGRGGGREGGGGRVAAHGPTPCGASPCVHAGAIAHVCVRALWVVRACRYLGPQPMGATTAPWWPTATRRTPIGTVWGTRATLVRFSRRATACAGGRTGWPLCASAWVLRWGNKAPPPPPLPDEVYLTVIVPVSCVLCRVFLTAADDDNDTKRTCREGSACGVLPPPHTHTHAHTTTTHHHHPLLGRTVHHARTHALHRTAMLGQRSAGLQLLPGPGCDAVGCQLRVCCCVCAVRRAAVDAQDNCPLVSNRDQKNSDGDALGDACDPGACTARTHCGSLVRVPGTCPAWPQFSPLTCGVPACPGADDDNDGRLDAADNCPQVSNADQKDTDRDRKGGCPGLTPPPRLLACLLVCVGGGARSPGVRWHRASDCRREGWARKVCVVS